MSVFTNVQNIPLGEGGVNENWAGSVQLNK